MEEGGEGEGEVGLVEEFGWEGVYSDFDSLRLLVLALVDVRNLEKMNFPLYYPTLFRKRATDPRFVDQDFCFEVISTIS